MLSLPECPSALCALLRSDRTRAVSAGQRCADSVEEGATKGHWMDAAEMAREEVTAESSSNEALSNIPCSAHC